MSNNKQIVENYLQAEKEAFEAIIAQIVSHKALSDEDCNRYDDALRNELDIVADIQDAKEEGREEGKYSEKLRIAQSLIQQGFANEMIANTTALPIAEVEKLREQYESR